MSTKSKSKYTKKDGGKTLLLYLPFGSRPNDIGLMGKTLSHVYTLFSTDHSLPCSDFLFHGEILLCLHMLIQITLTS